MNKQNILLSLVALLTAGFACGAAELPGKRAQGDGLVFMTADEATRKLQRFHCCDGEDSSEEEISREIISLVKAKANPDILTVYCETPLLSHFVYANKREVVASLLDCKANLEARARFEFTPLFYGRSAEMIKLLLDRGANIYARAGFGNQSILHNAARECRSTQVLALLCQCGLDVNEVDENGITPFLSLVCGIDSRAQCKEKEDAQKYRIKKTVGVLYWYGADLELGGDAGETAFSRLESTFPHYAVEVRSLIGKLSFKREDARKSLESLLTAHLDGESLLGAHIVAYSGAPGLTAKDIDSWDELIE